MTEPLWKRLYDSLVADIRSGRLAPGDRLPPSRRLALQLGLSRQTVLAAYEELTADGWVSGHVGRGTYVLGHTPHARPQARAV